MVFRVQIIYDMIMIIIINYNIYYEKNLNIKNFILLYELIIHF